ncbi:nucleotide exchange factor GrpE [Allorhizocola rhizosphaerae]|uniref:nucleotide exchange factor GrpE n=1 Tax=Allorhizocola rhizosphaerae TaxID=1872709 RepID=UPI000E3CA722|nr:nucleotide exchange factor GrpE [Allorhizocola rhizosphaerae]
MTDKPSAKSAPEESGGGERIVIRDKRKVSPSGTAGAKPAEPEKQPETPPDPVATTATAPVDAAKIGELESALDERTKDLQRVTAEYANYRKRVERDRTLAAEQAVGMVLAALLPVLDDIDRARDHGDLNGPFGSVAEQLVTVVGKFGLTAFGVKGDPFDPKLHEAVAHLTSAEVTESTCIDVMRRGYLLGERLLRPAMVAVADPAPEPSPAPAAAATQEAKSEPESKSESE